MDLLNLGHEKVTKWRVVHDSGGWGMGVGLYMIAVGGGCIVHDSSGWGRGVVLDSGGWVGVVFDSGWGWGGVTV